MEKDNDLSVTWENLNLNINGATIKYPLLVVKIWGKQNLVSLLKLMDKINKMTSSIKNDYISLTDFTNLSVGTLMESIISLSMNKSLKTLIGVSNKSKISFVLFGKDTSSQKLKERLNNLNETETERDYRYNYVFIDNKSQIKELAEKFLSNNNLL